MPKSVVFSFLAPGNKKGASQLCTIAQQNVKSKTSFSFWSDGAHPQDSINTAKLSMDVTKKG